MSPRRFTYTASTMFPELHSGLPYMPITLLHGEQAIKVTGLVDSGASISVLPYDAGLQLGLVWETQTYPLDLTILFQGSPTYGVVVMGQIDPFPPVPLAFAWTQRNDVRPILGQMNFFQQFDVHFYGSQNMFEIVPKCDSPMSRKRND